ncbi:MAG: hypothetical protein KatS3mg029_0531 [Saprospiraceae bacterium]|nr:MAG: hypothetical protein KatS3mg029_0531 [Saprospiraceae bacterium]
MKLTSFLLLAIAAFGFTGCLKDSCERTVSYIRLDPVYKTPDEIHAATLSVEAPRQLENPGQIYYYDNKIFINERREGIHVIDNSDPSFPLPLAFLAIPGNEDLAIRNGILYANTYTDLLAIDLTTNEVKGRAEDVFPPLWVDDENGRVAVYLEETPVTEVMDCESYGVLYERGGELIFVDDGMVNTFLEQNASSTSGSGIGGSMARFTIVDAYLYIVDQNSLEVFSLSNPFIPERISELNLGWGIETIIPYEDKLFIGSTSGMFIFDNSNPAAPYQLARFAHARACDPVFVQGDIAYVTLRSGTPCQGFNNQLDVIDISVITQPKLLVSFPMDNPHGLSVRENDLLLCEGDYGFKRFDASDPLEVGNHLLDHVKSFHAFDVIALPGSKKIALVIGEDGFYQYSFEDPKKLKLISKIPVKH